MLALEDFLLDVESVSKAAVSLGRARQRQTTWFLCLFNFCRKHAIDGHPHANGLLEQFSIFLAKQTWEDQHFIKASQAFLVYLARQSPTYQNTWRADHIQQFRQNLPDEVFLGFDQFLNTYWNTAQTSSNA